MITFLRFAGLAIAATWLGGTVLYVLALGPLFGQAEFVRLLGPLHAGETGVRAAERFHLFQVACASIAVIQALAEWLYSGRPIDRRLLLLLLVLLALGSVGRLWLAPKCRALNFQSYLGPHQQVLRQPVTPAQRQAEQSLAVWQGVAVVLNVISLAGVVLYLGHEASPGNGGPRNLPSKSAPDLTNRLLGQLFAWQSRQDQTD